MGTGASTAPCAVNDYPLSPADRPTRSPLPAESGASPLEAEGEWSLGPSCSQTSTTDRQSVCLTSLPPGEEDTEEWCLRLFFLSFLLFRKRSPAAGKESVASELPSAALEDTQRSCQYDRYHTPPSSAGHPQCQRTQWRPQRRDLNITQPTQGT